LSQPSSFELEHFEQVPATATTLLLRVAGRGRTKAPRLVVVDGAEERALEPLPGPPAPRGEVRAAFSLPAETVRQGATFALDLGGRRRVELPAPRDRTDARREVHAELEAIARNLQTAQRRSARLTTEVQALRTRLEEERGAARERDALELALLAARAEADELRRAHEDTVGRVVVLEAAARAAEREAEALRLRLGRRDGTFHR
jgi:hypothetical protein